MAGDGKFLEHSRLSFTCGELLHVSSPAETIISAIKHEIPKRQNYKIRKKKLLNLSSLGGKMKSYSKQVQKQS
jgi:hypothetical protein